MSRRTRSPPIDAANRGALSRPPRLTPVPTLALFEIYRGALRSAGPGGVGAVAGSLEWVDPLPLTEGAAREAAAVEEELRDAGTPINLGDVLLAGVCREAGASIVTRDEQFDRVPGLEVLND